MNRGALGVACVALALAASGGASGIGAQQRVFRADANAVLVDVAVRQGRRVVADLTAGDFELLDNGVRQTVELLSAGQVMPVDVSVLIDVSETARHAVLPAGEGFVRGIRSALGDADRLEILNFGSLVRRVPAARPVNVPGDIEQRHTGLWDALAAALMQPVDPARRKVIVALTDTGDSNSILDLPHVEAIAERSDATAYMVAIPPEAWGAVYWGAWSFHDFTWRLRRVLDASGGRLIELRATDDLVAPIRDALGELRTRYLLRYTPEGVTPGGWHEIEVKITRSRRYDVRARKGYQWRQ